MHNGPNGRVANLTVVSRYQRPAEAGGVEIASQYYRVSVFKPDAIDLAEKLEAGSPVRVRGKIQNQPYKDSQGIDQIGLQIQIAGPRAALEKTPARAEDLADFNRARLIGRFGADPVLTADDSGRFAFLRVATTETWRDKRTGDPREDTQWHSVGVFAPKLVEAAAKLKKGDLVNIEGAVRHTARTDSDGHKRSGSQVQLSGPDAKLRAVTVEQKQSTGRGSR